MAAQAASLPDQVRFVSRYDWLNDHSKALSDEARQTDNVFAERWMLAAALRHCGSDDVIVAEMHGSDGQLLGRAPLISRARFGRLPLRHIAVWNHPNGFAAPVFIAPGQESRFWDALLVGLAASRWARRHVLLAIEGLPADDPASAGLREAAKQLHLPMRQDRAFDRAMLDNCSNPITYWENAVRPKKRKELRRQHARMAELGDLRLQLCDQPDQVSGWIDSFFALESKGWKGTAGSALASAPSTRAFFEEVVKQAAARNRFSGLALYCDQQPLAMLAILTGADMSYSFKTTYDESFARFSPGVLLQRHALDHFAALNLQRVDSCADPNHPMIDSLWRERRTIIALSIALPGIFNRLGFQTAQLAIRGYHHSKSSLSSRNASTKAGAA